ncbi:UNVERIFIED_CONTAM: hypothetical protein Sradi_2373300 [Sesamum radiatum]|uniref:Transposase-associated domain-containing protein n=1 Tax=Sesamum radiatum TaxID=300843 RepID=A0AAW2T632_SESRA
MYNKNLPWKTGLTPEFEDGVKIFIEWAKGQRGHIDGDKIRCPCRKCKNTKFETTGEVSYHLCMREFMPEYYNWTSHGDDSIQEYFEATTVPPVPEEQNLNAHVKGNYPHLGDEKQIDWHRGWFFMQPGRVVFLLLTMVCR